MVYRQRINAGPWRPAICHALRKDCSKSQYCLKLYILIHTQYQSRVCTTSKVSYKHMYMHIFISIHYLSEQINKTVTVDFVIYLTHGEDHKVTEIHVYCASLHCIVSSRLNRTRLARVQMALS